MVEKPPKIEGSENEPVLEIEQKYILASEKDAQKLEGKIKKLFPKVEFLGGYSETSYYFPGVSKETAKKLLNLVAGDREEGPDLMAKLDRIPDGLPISPRLKLRKNNENKTFILTFKASKNPLHDVERIQIESGDISENFLEGFAGNGVEPESVWHSNRREYQINENTKVDVQDVTGYGWTAEVESTNPEEVKSVADNLGLQPLSEEQLDAMYRQYQKRWNDYYEGDDDARHFSKDDWKEAESISGQKIVKNRVK